MGFDIKVLEEEDDDFIAVATLDCCAAGTCKPDCEITPAASGAMKAKVSALTVHDRQIRCCPTLPPYYLLLPYYYHPSQIRCAPLISSMVPRGWALVLNLSPRRAIHKPVD